MQFRNQKKFEIFLPSFGAHIPDAPKKLQEQNIYPLATRSESGFDLDFTSLLVADGIILDTFAWEYINDGDKPQFNLMRDSISKLQDAGLCRLVNYREYAKKYELDIRSRVSELLEIPDVWLPIARKHWYVYKNEIPEIVKRMPSGIDKRAEYLHFGIYCHLKSISDTIDYKEAERLTQILESRKQRLSSSDSEDFREIIRPVLSHILFTQLLRVELKSPFVDWNDLRSYYQHIERPLWLDKLSPGSNMQVAIANKCKEMFEIALPELKPGSIDQTLKFLKDKKAVISLKEQLSESLIHGTPFDIKWATELRNAANLAQVSARGRQRVVTWIGSILGAIPIPSLSSAVQIGAELAHDAVVEVAGSKVESSKLHQFEWYFALLLIKANEKPKS